MSEQLDNVFDDEEAVKFIQNYLPQELKSRFSDDEVYYILDLICEFFEGKDFLDDEDEEKEERELNAFIRKQAKKDEIGDYTEEEITFFLKAESAYGDTLNLL